MLYPQWLYNTKKTGGMILYKVVYKKGIEVLFTYVYAELPEDVFRVLKKYNEDVYDGFISMECMEGFGDNILIQDD